MHWYIDALICIPHDQLKIRQVKQGDLFLFGAYSISSALLSFGAV